MRADVDSVIAGLYLVFVSLIELVRRDNEVVDLVEARCFILLLLVPV